MEKLGDQRALVDKGTADQQGVYAYYTDLIAVDLRLFTALSHVDTGEVTWISKTLVNSFWAKEMLAREDAILARGWPSGKLSASDYQLVQQSIGAQEHLFTVQVVPYVPTDERAAWSELMSGPAWQAKAAVEQALTRPAVADTTGTVRLPQLQDQWRQAVDQVNPQLVKVIETRTEGVVEVGKGSILSLLTRVALTSVIGLLAVVVVVIASWRLTRSLRRRINDLHAQAQDMEHTLPEMVERLARGEQVDVEAESRAITAGAHARGGDELAQLGQAMNLARASALGAAVRQAEQHRGFERLLQRIARRTQLLIGQQLRKLDALERRHEDPEVLEGLFDLDHLTARLRRYEENLVIMAAWPAAAEVAQAGAAAGRAARRAGRGPGVPPDRAGRRGLPVALRAGGRPDRARGRRADGERGELLQAADAGRRPGGRGRPRARDRDRGPRSGHGAGAVRHGQRPDGRRARGRAAPYGHAGAR